MSTPDTAAAMLANSPSTGTAPHLVAEQTSLDQATLFVSPEAFDEFLARLNAPAAPNERLRHTMQTVSLTVPP
jgi:uncharacterized protein (DUF1778 family)